MELVFEPGESGNPEIVVEMDKLAYAWFVPLSLSHTDRETHSEDAAFLTTNRPFLGRFGIPREISCYTRSGLKAVRQTLNPTAVADVGSFNDKVAAGIAAEFGKLPAVGEVDLYDISKGTFWGVTKATLTPIKCKFLNLI